MTSVPATLRTALEDVPVTGSTCLEAGAGAGNATAALRERGAGRVYAVTDDDAHVRDVADRFDADEAAVPVRGDLRAIPLPDDAVEVVTAHALFNVVSTTEIADIVAELTRVIEPGGYLVVDDYGPIPDAPVRELFAVANAVGELDDARPTFTFYPRPHVRALLEGFGWSHEWSRTLLDPVPWTSELLDTHTELIRERADDLPDELGGPLKDHARTVRDRLGDGVETGEMYSLVFTRST
jgi:SAM-dependent methyltransferase